MDQDKVLDALGALTRAVSHTLELVVNGEPYDRDMAEAALIDVARTLVQLTGSVDKDGQLIAKTSAE